MAALEALLAGVTRAPDANGYGTLTFSAVNVQIVDGSGDTPCTHPLGGSGALCNGLGNLIVGYNEDITDNGVETRTGTHSIVLGQDHEWTAYSHLVSGLQHEALNDNASLFGGHGSTASGILSVVTGGWGHDAVGDLSSISGGGSNEATATGASVSGGFAHVASGPYSSISGGRRNEASGSHSSVTGGINNIASGDAATVSGGGSETPGDGNEANDLLSVVSGGINNIADAEYGVVSGGRDNTVDDTGCPSGVEAPVVSGGRGNRASGCTSVVSGGWNRTVTDIYDWRAGTLFETE